MPANQVYSPTSTDAPLEYITVDAYEWPKPPRPQRAPMAEDERKRRHREGQRQFMLRKRSRILELRRELDRTETKLNYMWALNEEKLLREDKEHLERFKALEDGEHGRGLSFYVPSSTIDSLEETALDEILSDVLRAL